MVIDRCVFGEPLSVELKMQKVPCKKKKYNSRFPPARIKKIMQSDDEVGKVAAVVPIIICESECCSI